MLTLFLLSLTAAAHPSADSHHPPVDCDDRLVQAVRLLDEARVDEAEAVLCAGDDATTLTVRAGIAARRGHHAAASDLLRHAVHHDPDHGPARRALALHLAGAGDLAAAIGMLSPAVHGPSDAAQLATWLLRTGRSSEALTVTTGAILAHGPVRALLRLHVQATERTLGPAQALSEVPEDDDPEWRLERARLHAALGHTGEAHRALSEAETLLGQVRGQRQAELAARLTALAQELR